MKITERKIKIDLEFNIPTLIANDNTVFELKDETINKMFLNLVNDLKETINKEKNNCLMLDKKHEFFSFKEDYKNLKYDEENPNSYKHFVHHFLKNYYVDSRNSQHYINGGHWTHSEYDTKMLLHENMLNDNKNLSVRDYILNHLVTGRGVRMYGGGMNGRHVRELESVDEQKDFWKFVLDSGMINLNDEFKIPKSFRDKDENNFKYVSTYIELIIHKCWRDNNLEVLKWIIDTYKVDLRKIEKLSLIKTINVIHDKRIHRTYNNDVLVRKYDYLSKKELSKKEQDKKWENHSFYQLVEFIKYFKSNYPDLLHTLDEHINIKFRENSDSDESIDELLNLITL